MKRLRLIQAEENQPQKRITRIIKVGAVLFGLVLILEIWMANHLSTYGSKIEELGQAKAVLELENQMLENTIAQKSSLLSVESSANILGFQSIANLEYYQVEPLASSQQAHDLASAL